MNGLLFGPIEENLDTTKARTRDEERFQGEAREAEKRSNLVHLNLFLTKHHGEFFDEIKSPLTPEEIIELVQRLVP